MGRSKNYTGVPTVCEPFDFEKVQIREEPDAILDIEVSSMAHNKTNNI